MAKGSSGIGNNNISPYLEGYIKNNPWLEEMPEKSRKAIIDNFNNMPDEKKFYYSLTEQEQSALMKMQVNTKLVNQLMSGRDTDIPDSKKTELNEEITLVKSAIGKYQLQEPMTVYRGVGKQEFDNIMEGGMTESFKSTSTDRNRAESFAKNQGGYIVEYRTSPGVRIANVDGVPGANEKEMLLDSGVKYKRVVRNGNRVIIDL